MVANALIIPWVLKYGYGEPLSIPFMMLTVGAGELVVVTIIGCVLFKLVFERSSRLMNVIGANKPNYFKKKPAEI